MGDGDSKEAPSIRWAPKRDLFLFRSEDHPREKAEDIGESPHPLLIDEYPLTFKSIEKYLYLSFYPFIRNEFTFYFKKFVFKIYSI